MEQSRLKSPVFWGGIAVLVVNFLIAIEAITVTQSDALKAAIAGILNAVAAFAVANNPTNKTGF